jgi:hypothetical protein
LAAVERPKLGNGTSADCSVRDHQASLHLLRTAGKNDWIRSVRAAQENL